MTRGSVIERLLEDFERGVFVEELARRGAKGRSACPIWVARCPTMRLPANVAAVEPRPVGARRMCPQD